MYSTLTNYKLSLNPAKKFIIQCRHLLLLEGFILVEFVAQIAFLKVLKRRGRCMKFSRNVWTLQMISRNIVLFHIVTTIIVKHSGFKLTTI